MKTEMMQTFVGKTLKVDRGGPESRIGKLLAVGEDFFSLLTQDEGVIFYTTHHIKSITENSKNKFGLEIEAPQEFVAFPTFRKAINSLQWQWVKINRGGKESLEGVLEDVNDDFITVVMHEEIIRISMFHVRNISLGVKTEEKKEDSETEKENQKAQNKGKGKKR
ncbi:hypothetical protein [Peribacillus kribbensis]|uniref:hypothetical protein n=1 Tax=Peribacillus kribbensis TaxID=356658 RepID=UPI0004292AA9|nr:hypothetical protein [Peribacillus kribbensis]